MMQAQIIPAFIAALLAEGVQPERITNAVQRVQRLKLGESIDSNNELWRAFSNEQANRLKAVVDG